LNISVITATFNNAETVSDCLSSLNIQLFNDFEHIVVDGGSTDGTFQLLQNKEFNIKALISEADDGVYHALNKGIALSKGEVIGFLHADDAYVDSEVLLKVSQAFSNASVQAIYGDLVYVERGDIGKITRNWVAGKFLTPNLKKGWMPPHPTLFLRRSLYEKFGLFDTRYRIAADYDFMLRVLAQLEPEQIVYIPEVLVRMRTGGVSNRSLKQLIKKSWEDYQIIRKHKLGGLGSLFRKNFSKLPQFFSK